MPIKIRQAANEDLPAILAFEQAVVAAERPYNNEVKDGTVQYYDMAALISSDQSRVLVAEDSERLVATGHATLKPSSNYLNHDRHAYLGLMFVEPEYRGQGIIQEIIEGLLQWARSKGVTNFYLDVYGENEAAVKAYEKLGFRQNLVEMRLYDK
jgi:GNAT superfamily N-acetyltransferase